MGEVSLDWLMMFFSDVVLSVQLVIQVYQDVLYLYLIQFEIMCVGLNQREFDCLNMIVNGYNIKGVVYKFDVINVMVFCYFWNVQEKLCVFNLVIVVLKVQWLNFVVF